MTVTVIAFGDVREIAGRSVQTGFLAQFTQRRGLQEFVFALTSAGEIPQRNRMRCISRCHQQHAVAAHDQRRREMHVLHEG